ncbi:MAG: rhodanese-like domain-containing protein [Candidatus Binataceae bacterium]
MARKLKDCGFAEVYPLRGGFKAWKQAGLPVEPVHEGDGRN